jgi:hypothetical protein
MRANFAPAASLGSGAEAGLRIGYVISAYHKPQMVVRLVRRLNSPQNRFYIHYDLRSPEGEFNELQQAFRGMGNVTLLERHRCRWGDFGHVLASLKGIRAMMAGETKPDYAILLTGQDYPIKSNALISRQLQAAAGRSFMQASAWPVPQWENGRGIRRIQNYHLHFGMPRWARSLGWQPGWQHLTIPMRRKVPGGLHPYFGSGYWYLHRDCVEYIQNYVDEHPDFVRFFRGVLIPDECFFHILLMNSPLAKSFEQRTLTYMDWRPPWPGILKMQDLPKLQQSDCLFARKFDPAVDGEVLNKLDASFESVPT